MQLTVNGAPQTAPDGVTIHRLLQLLELARGPVAVEVNREVIPRAEHAEHVLREGDVLEIVHFVGGG